MKLQIMLVFLPYLLPKEFIMINILLVEDDKEICVMNKRPSRKSTIIKSSSHLLVQMRLNVIKELLPRI